MDDFIGQSFLVESALALVVNWIINLVLDLEKSMIFSLNFLGFLLFLVMFPSVILFEKQTSWLIPLQNKGWIEWRSIWRGFKIFGCIEYMSFLACIWCCYGYILSVVCRIFISYWRLDDKNLNLLASILWLLLKSCCWWLD